MWHEANMEDLHLSDDKIEMELNLFLLSGLVIYKTFYLVALKQTQPRSNRAMGSETTKVKHFKKKFVGPNFWIQNKGVFQVSQNWDVTGLPPLK